MSRSSGRPARVSRGFTLIELLVVITIIGMLMALLLPATNAVRGQMQRAACLNNQRQVSMSVLQVVAASSNNVFPGWRNIIYPNPSNPSASLYCSWVVLALPGLQQGQLYQQFRSGTVPTVVPYLEVLVCPSDPPQNTTSPALDYVVNAGMMDANGGIEKITDGLFFDRSSTKPLTMTLSKIPDGAESTLMMSENMNLVKLLNPTLGWGDTSSYTVTKPIFSFCWWASASTNGTVNPYRKINGGKVADPSLPTATANDYARPASNHSGGVNVAFASGRETWLREDIAYYVYQQLMTPDGQRASTIAVDTTGTPYLLLDSDYKQ